PALSSSRSPKPRLSGTGGRCLLTRPLKTPELLVPSRRLLRHRVRAGRYMTGSRRGSMNAMTGAGIQQIPIGRQADDEQSQVLDLAAMPISAGRIYSGQRPGFAWAARRP